MSERRDRFMLDCGVRDTDPFDAAARELVLGNFIGFLRSGGQFTWSDWANMSDATCQLAGQAGTMVEAERIGALIAALRGPVEPPVLPAATRRQMAEDERIRKELDRATAETAASLG